MQKCRIAANIVDRKGTRSKMARTKQSAAKRRREEANGTYGSLSTSKSKSRSKEKQLFSKSDKSKKLTTARSKAKIESAAKKANKSSTSNSSKLKAKTKHHVAKFTRNSIKQRVNHAAESKHAIKSSSQSNVDKRSDKISIERASRNRRKNKQPKRLEFQMNIADSNYEFFLRPENVPWFKAEEQVRFRDNISMYNEWDGESKTLKNVNNRDDEETLQLPSDKVLSYIDTEIKSFSAYVKLTPSERRARTAFLSHITEILTTQFANGGRGGYRRQQSKDDDEKVYVEPFGSYATQEVCTFASDVDMCLWGLVKEEVKPNSHLKFVSSDSNETEDVEETSCILTTNKCGECPLLTESSLLRTMDAIQASVKSKDNNVSSDEPKDANNANNETDDNNCLFVIDRIGHQEDEPENNSTTHSDCQTDSDDKDQSNNMSTEQVYNQEQRSREEKQKQKKSNTPKEQFEFVVNVDGVAELGGDLEDLPTNEELSSEPAKLLNETDDKPNRKSHDKFVNIDDDSSQDSEVILIDDNDSADKLESFYSRQPQKSIQSTVQLQPKAAGFASSPSSSNHEQNEVISVGDSNSDSDYANHQNSRREVLELSLTSNVNTNSTEACKSIVKPVFGPTGKIRARVVSVLHGLTSHLRRSSFINTVGCRSKARVPIINCNTRTGFEGDIAIGGHNGVDTSTYAQSQANRFQSFAPIVLILKVLMVQQGLDKPFTGGLGSYKLYVLVAHHIECHIANGGNDRPSEILISLLFRYSNIGRSDDKSTTDLESVRNCEGLIASDGGVCDLAPVFRIPDVVEMFRECHERLFDRMLLADGFDDEYASDKFSFLSSMIDCFRLREARESSDKRSRISDEITRPIGLDHPGKVNPSRRIGKVFSKNEYTTEPKRHMNFSDILSNKRSRSYNAKSFNTQNRGPKGGLIPLHRPDVAAMKSLKANAEKELLLRGTKNRKNKKKQARDDALRAFAKRSI